MNLTTDLPKLLMNKVIVHYIPKHKKDEFDKPVKFSKKVSDLSDGLKTFFKKKIIEALNSDRAFRICYDSTSNSPVPSLVKSYLSDVKGDFIETSKKITDRLYKVQTGINPSGIVLLINGVINDISILTVMKLEPDSGAQMTFDDAAESIDIQEVENLMLTQRTKFFKIAMLLYSPKKKENYDGILMDFQINVQSKIRIESFFLDDFLGCKAYKDPRTVTKAFYEITRTFINSIDNPILKTKYLNDLNSYVQSNKKVISPKSYADEFLTSPEDKQSYKDHLQRNRFPFESFQKNNQYIERKLQKITIEFDNDISIIAKQGDIGKKIKLDEIKQGENKGKHKAEIIANIKKSELMDIAAIVDKWKVDAPNYKKLGKVVFSFLKSEIKEIEISPIISFRTKEQLSIIKKIRKKQIETPAYSYDSLTDKLGVRIICNFNSDLIKVYDFLDKYFHIINKDIKKDNISFNKLDYQSNHYDVKLKSTNGDFKNCQEFKDFVFEIQVRTINQNAWADVAHSLIYKQESEIGDSIKRRIFRLIALYELADDEFNAINDSLKSMSDNYIYSLLKMLEGKFYKLSRCDFDRDYSIANLKIILSFFSEEQRELLKKSIDFFITSNEEKIIHIFNDNKQYFLSSSYLTQPEIFVIWFALENFEFYLTSNWINNFDYQELEDIANWWGLNIEQTL